jgi:glycosyltransferase involved in cell wall biosynthesis
MSLVSIVLPTYNRADTIGRAIQSIQSQTFTDWELVVVDDGSSDSTAQVLAGYGARVRVVRQANQGCYAARNAGLNASTGPLVAFMDSDDEWLPQFLELAVGLLQHQPDAQYVLTEFYEGDGALSDMVRHDLHEVSRRYPQMAREVGSTLMNLPPGETDPYLRVFAKREPIGSWGVDAARQAGHPDAFVYRGNIFECLRFGHLGWLPTTVVRREAIDAVGLFLPHYRTAADYRFLGLLFRRSEAFMIGVPLAIKHLTASGGATLNESHLATGRHEYRYASHRLPLYDEFFWSGDRVGDLELGRIRARYHLYAAQAALECEMVDAAREHLKQALDGDSALFAAKRLQWLLAVSPTSAMAMQIYRMAVRIGYRLRRLSERGGH